MNDILIQTYIYIYIYTYSMYIYAKMHFLINKIIIRPNPLKYEPKNMEALQ